ncbi:hypothetical protein QYE76_069612 [Lolium multiflorum]|uniref:MULE transposase domain-containing protein n=1 Tax=Lolium multiflorum TaxID=4521 RepID=A0AAD8SIK1_LOLMU|nr:hypothetical protein QYE76_069612 [Lolium multiflorum]
MATGGGGGGGGPGGWQADDEQDPGGDHLFLDEGYPPVAAEPEPVPQLSAPVKPGAPWEKGWTSAGSSSSSSVDPMSHYISDNGLETEMWELFVQFDGVKFVQKSMPRSDVRYLNLLALMEKEGYGICDSMYYVKEEGEGWNGLDLVDSNFKVEEMIRRLRNVLPEWVPSDDEEDQGFINVDDDDGFQEPIFVQPKGRKSRAKKYKPRVWYDENRENPTQQFILKLCFRDVYQFRESLARFHNQQDKAKKDFGVSVPKRMAYRAKTKARQMVLGDHKKQYFRIRDYLQTVIDKNPGSRCIVTTVTGPSEEETEAMKQGHNADISYEPRFHGRDGNNNMYPIAWAVVAKEDTKNWVWFLEQLKEALGGDEGQFGRYTIMSDRQKGLLKAVSTVFPNSPQRYCLRHIYANFQTAGFRGEDLKKCMDNAAYSYTKHGFDVAMEELKKQSEAAWVWLSKIPVHTWARWAMDTNCKTDLVVNNLSEVFNRYILDVRSKPIVTMLVGIYDKQMVRHDGKRVGGQQASWAITPHYTEMLELMKKYSRACVPKRSDIDLWQPSRTMPPSGSTGPSASTAPSATAPSGSAPSALRSSATRPPSGSAPSAPRSSATRPPTASAPSAPRSSATRPPTAPPGPRSSAQGRGQGVYSYFTAGANASAGREPGVGPLGNSYAGPSCSPDDC